MTMYTVKYHAGTYEGTVTVWADDESEAIELARAKVRKSMTLTMYSDSYRVIR